MVVLVVLEVWKVVDYDDEWIFVYCCVVNFDVVVVGVIEGDVVYEIVVDGKGRSDEEYEGEK